MLRLVVVIAIVSMHCVLAVGSGNGDLSPHPLET